MRVVVSLFAAVHFHSLLLLSKSRILRLIDRLISSVIHGSSMERTRFFLTWKCVSFRSFVILWRCSVIVEGSVMPSKTEHQSMAEYSLRNASCDFFLFSLTRSHGAAGSSCARAAFDGQTGSSLRSQVGGQIYMSWRGRSYWNKRGPGTLLLAGGGDGILSSHRLGGQGRVCSDHPLLRCEDSSLPVWSC